MKTVSFLFLSIILSCVAIAQQPAVTDSVKPVEVPPGFTKQLDVIYTQVNGWDGKLDLYLPPNQGKPVPLIINIHGGGWNKGTKETQGGFSIYFKNGFAVANVEYRLTGQATAPAAVEDCRCALIYIIKNQKALNIDPDRIVVMGSSAGGHLALMTGLLANDSKFDGNCKGVKNIKVAAIVDKYGITDVADWAGHSKSANAWLGAKAGDQEFTRSVSPIYYVNKNNPPVFIAHGDADPLVPYSESVDMIKALNGANVKNVFLTIPGGLHGKFPADKNREMNEAIILFLKEVKVI